MHHSQRRPMSQALTMDTSQAKWFLRIFAHGKKLDKLTIRELYLSGYIAIDLQSPASHPLPSAITEKGKRALGILKA